MYKEITRIEQDLGNFTALQQFLNYELKEQDLDISKEKFMRKLARFCVKMLTTHGIPKERTIRFLERKFNLILCTKK